PDESSAGGAPARPVCGPRPPMPFPRRGLYHPQGSPSPPPLRKGRRPRIRPYFGSTERTSLMIPTLALAAALGLAPSQPAGALSLKNVRVTYGELGAPRNDDKLLPGDLYFIAFDIEGIKVDAAGKVSYSMAMDVTDKAGKSIF